MTFNILFAGVGGLGAMLTSVIIARAAHIEGYFVNGSQVHGLAQRGGSIPIQVRFNKEEIYSPMIRKGGADLIIGFELIEALRYPELANKEKTVFLIDPQEILPVILNKPYPSLEGIKEEITKVSKKALFVNAGKICKEEFRDLIYGNVMLLGVAIKEGILPLKKESILEALKVTVPKDIDKNIAAFEFGLNSDKK